MNPINPYSIQSPPPFCQTIFPNLGNRNINLRAHQFPLSGNKSFRFLFPKDKFTWTQMVRNDERIHAVCPNWRYKPRKHYYKEEKPRSRFRSSRRKQSSRKIVSTRFVACATALTRKFIFPSCYNYSGQTM